LPKRPQRLGQQQSDLGNPGSCKLQKDWPKDLKQATSSFFLLCKVHGAVTSPCMLQCFWTGIITQSPLRDPLHELMLNRMTGNACGNGLTRVLCATLA
jgi:hypothetical protein